MTATNDTLRQCAYPDAAGPVTSKARRVAEEVLTKTEIRKVYAFVPYRDHETSVNYIDFAHAIVAAALVKLTQGQEAVFWYRPRSDGCYEGPIHNAQIEKVRKESGGWVPLYTHPAPSQQEERVRELERVLDVAREDIVILSRLANSDHTGPRASISAIDAALSKEQGK